jgi:glutamate synthase domain-containing protein 3
MVELESVETDTDIGELKALIENHRKYTGSTVAHRLLELWPSCLSEFVKVMPIDYKRVMMARQQSEEEDEEKLAMTASR